MSTYLFEPTKVNFKRLSLQNSSVISLYIKHFIRLPGQFSLVKNVGKLELVENNVCYKLYKSGPAEIIFDYNTKQIFYFKSIHVLRNLVLSW